MKIEKLIDTEEVSVVNGSNTIELITEIAVGKLTSNAKEYKAAIEKELISFSVERYIDNPDAAKVDKAYLNKLKEDVTEKRKTALKLWNSPLQEFENEMKTLEKLIDTASKELREIVIKADTEIKDKKYAEIENFYSSLGFNLISLDKIFNSKWLNKTYKIKDIEKELKEKIDTIKSELLTINSLQDEDKEVLKSFYLDSLSLEKTLQEGNRLKTNRAILRQQEENTIIEKAQEEKPIIEKTQTQNGIVDEIMEYTLRIKGPKSKLFLLRQFIEKNGLEYEKV